MKIKIIALLTVALFLAIAWWLMDSSIDEDYKDWLESYQGQIVDYNDAYVYLKGLDAPSGADPIHWGKKKLQGEETGAESILLPESEGLFCNIERPDCLRSLLDKKNEVKRQISIHAELYGRYRAFIKGLLPELMEVHPGLTKGLPTSAMQYGARLHLLNIYYFHQTPKQAFLDYIERLKQELSISQTLYLKVMDAYRLNEALRFLGLWLSVNDQTLDEPLKYLTSDQASFLRPLQHQYEFVDQQIDETIEETRTHEEESSIFDRIPNLWFKPNITRNESFYYLKSVAGISEGSQETMVQALEQARKNLNNLKNPLGHRILHASHRLYQNYIYAVQDLNLQIALINNIQYLNHGLAKSEVANPYGKDYSSQVMVSNGWACLQSPSDDLVLEGFQTRACLYLAR